MSVRGDNQSEADSNPVLVSEWLDRAVAGRLDELTPEQIEALEEHLNRDPAAAARLADVVPPADARLQGAERPPSPDVWAAMFERIDAASAPATQPGGAAWSAHVRRIQRWGTVAAAAACVVLALLWSVRPQPAPEPWPLELAGNVVVHELEVSGGATSFVANAGESGPTVIWIIEDSENGEAEGA